MGRIKIHGTPKQSWDVETYGSQTRTKNIFIITIYSVSKSRKGISKIPVASALLAGTSAPEQSNKSSADI